MKAEKKPALISINEAALRGIERLRKPIWSHPLDHLKLALKGNAMFGVWAQLYCPFNKECNGRDPVEMLVFQLDRVAPEWEPYTGALPDSDEYKAAVAVFDGCLSSGAVRGSSQ